MTDKELHKLNRNKLLELLLAQSKDVARQRTQISELMASLSEAQEQIERLKSKLDDKDAQLDKLKSRLDGKDVQLNRLKGFLEEKDAQLDKLKGRLDDKDAAISGLEGQLAAAIGKVTAGQTAAPAAEIFPDTVTVIEPASSTAGASGAVLQNVISLNVLAPHLTVAAEGDSSAGKAAAPGDGVENAAEEFLAIFRAAMQQYVEQRQDASGKTAAPALTGKQQLLKRLGAKMQDTRQTLQVWGGVWNDSWTGFRDDLASFRWKDTGLYSFLKGKSGRVS